MTAAASPETATNRDAPAACPICRAARPLPFVSIGGRAYWRCGRCEALFLDPCQLPSREQERAH